KEAALELLNVKPTVTEIDNTNTEIEALNREIDRLSAIHDRFIAKAQANREAKEQAQAAGQLAIDTWKANELTIEPKTEAMWLVKAPVVASVEVLAPAAETKSVLSKEAALEQLNVKTAETEVDNTNTEIEALNEEIDRLRAIHDRFIAKAKANRETKEQAQAREQRQQEAQAAGKLTIDTWKANEPEVTVETKQPRLLMRLPVAEANPVMSKEAALEQLNVKPIVTEADNTDADWQ